MVRRGTPADNRREAEQQHRDLDRPAGSRGRPSTAPRPRDLDQTATDDQHPPRHPGEGDYS